MLQRLLLLYYILLLPAKERLSSLVLFILVLHEKVPLSSLSLLNHSLVLLLPSLVLLLPLDLVLPVVLPDLSRAFVDEVGEDMVFVN